MYNFDIKAKQVSRMWKQRIGISIGNHYDISLRDVMILLKEIGYDAVSPAWETDACLQEIACAAKETGLFLQSLHAPFEKAADLWRDGMVSLQAKKRIVLRVGCLRLL